MNTPTLREIPTMCDICCAYPSDTMVPDRFELDDWTLSVYCPLCLDEFLSLFPIHFAALRRRELTGRYSYTHRVR